MPKPRLTHRAASRSGKWLAQTGAVRLEERAGCEQRLERAATSSGDSGSTSEPASLQQTPHTLGDRAESGQASRSDTPSATGSECWREASTSAVTPPLSVLAAGNRPSTAVNYARRGNFSSCFVAGMSRDTTLDAASRQDRLLRTEADRKHAIAQERAARYEDFHRRMIAEIGNIKLKEELRTLRARKREERRLAAEAAHQTRCAVKVQAFVRSVRSRREVATSRAMLAGPRYFFSNGEPLDISRFAAERLVPFHRAARAIQSWLRKALMRAEQQRHSLAAIAIQNKFRRIKEHEVRRRHRRACHRLQAACRGYLIRRYINSEHEDEDDDSDNDDDENDDEDDVGKVTRIGQHQGRGRTRRTVGAIGQRISSGPQGRGSAPMSTSSKPGAKPKQRGAGLTGLKNGLRAESSRDFRNSLKVDQKTGTPALQPTMAATHQQRSASNLMLGRSSNWASAQAGQSETEGRQQQAKKTKRRRSALVLARRRQQARRRAATNMQKAFRGYQARRELPKTFTKSARDLFKKQAEAAAEDRAARSIQHNFRGYQQRKSLTVEALEQEYPDDFEE